MGLATGRETYDKKQSALDVLYSKAAVLLLEQCRRSAQFYLAISKLFPTENAKLVDIEENLNQSVSNIVAEQERLKENNSRNWFQFTIDIAVPLISSTRSKARRLREQLTLRRPGASEAKRVSEYRIMRETMQDRMLLADLRRAGKIKIGNESSKREYAIAAILHTLKNQNSGSNAFYRGQQLLLEMCGSEVLMVYAFIVSKTAQIDVFRKYSKDNFSKNPIPTHFDFTTP